MTLRRLADSMISATGRWLRRNRTSLAIGCGAIGVGYATGQYLLSKITEARERMANDRIAKDKYKFPTFFPEKQALIAQLAPTIPTQSGRLYYNRSRITTYCGRQYYRSFANREDYTTVATETGREVGQKRRHVQSSAIRALVSDTKFSG